MSERPDLDADLEPPEQELGLRLAGQRALPAAEFRGALGRHLAAGDPGYGPRPGGLRMAVALYLVAGACLVALGALLALGVM